MSDYDDDMFEKMVALIMESFTFSKIEQSLKKEDILLGELNDEEKFLYTAIMNELGKAEMAIEKKKEEYKKCSNFNCSCVLSIISELVRPMMEAHDTMWNQIEKRLGKHAGLAIRLNTGGNHVIVITRRVVNCFAQSHVDRSKKTHRAIMHRSVLFLY